MLAQSCFCLRFSAVETATASVAAATAAVEFLIDLFPVDLTSPTTFASYTLSLFFTLFADSTGRIFFLSTPERLLQKRKRKRTAFPVFVFFFFIWRWWILLPSIDSIAWRQRLLSIQSVQVVWCWFFFSVANFGRNIQSILFPSLIGRFICLPKPE